jgi:signal peptidase I
MSKQKKGFIRETIETIVIALILALIIRAFIIQVFYIPSGSMEPTLGISDRIVVNKFIYRFREPRRNEIIVFKYPLDTPGQKGKDFIKRIIGLPGETLEVKEGKVYVNGSILIENHSMNSDQDHSNFGPIKIVAGNYFMMGDNRPNSADSRYWRDSEGKWAGLLPKNKILGLTIVRIWPLTKIGPIP